ncbi:NfeD family protein [Sphingomonas sanxanigenens]|uniref:NfeD-like C-terminal domain-containing protein n=1 Tax=Sphingomonas sanxanigenens DSM 19645 = NX02 TaxID=1123269 RepID=W0ACB7_9SPHN|nr:NfeD family protein [Sphingomonas sanxanigenens]AHE54177.1 hypothetical protein NX02_12380 [Sphingomonas sanxanigenens DSM 19645 = NX02]
MAETLPLEGHWLWMILGFAMGVVEIVAPGYFLIWLGVAALLTGIVALLTGITLLLQLAVFAVLAAIAVFAGRRWFGADAIDASDPLQADRAQRLVGHVVVVIEAIDHGRGRVEAGGGIWNARGLDAPVGAQLRAVGSDHGALLVEPLP